MRPYDHRTCSVTIGLCDHNDSDYRTAGQCDHTIGWSCCPAVAYGHTVAVLLSHCPIVILHVL